jgi:serine protease Do
MSNHRSTSRFLFAAGLLGLLGVWPVVYQQLTRAEPGAGSVALLASPAFAAAALPGGYATIADVAEASVASVVSIHTRSRPNMFGQTAHGGGSGVIVSEDGLIVTNNHVIEGMRDISVTLSDGRRFDARVIGGDRDSDLAVLRLDGAPRALKPMAMGDSDALRLGEVVLAIGNPFGVGQTVTMGIVSAKNREGFLQTDAAINPGNSGGALVNMKGELVGINAMILSRSGGNQGIGFAIPSNTSQPIVRDLASSGRVSKPWLGIQIQTVSAELAEALGLTAERGVLVAEALDGGPAAAAGVRAGDVILSINDEEIGSSEELTRAIVKAGVGKRVTLKAIRDGHPIDLEVTLGDRTAPRVGSGTDVAALGLRVAALSKDTRGTYKIPTRVRAGVVVTEIAEGSMARFVGIRPGDVILEVNRTDVNDPEDLARAFARGGDRTVLLIARGGSQHYVVLER